MSHSTELRGRACHRISQASGGEGLQIEEPVDCGDASAFDNQEWMATTCGRRRKTAISRRKGGMYKAVGGIEPPCGRKARCASDAEKSRLSWRESHIALQCVCGQKRLKFLSRFAVGCHPCLWSALGMRSPAPLYSSAMSAMQTDRGLHGEPINAEHRCHVRSKARDLICAGSRSTSPYQCPLPRNQIRLFVTAAPAPDAPAGCHSRIRCGTDRGVAAPAPPAPQSPPGPPAASAASG